MVLTVVKIAGSLYNCIISTIDLYLLLFKCFFIVEKKCYIKNKSYWNFKFLL